MNHASKPTVTVAYENAEASQDPLGERVAAYELQAEALCDLLRDTGAARLDTLEAARAVFVSGFALLNGALADRSAVESIRGR